MTLLSLFLSACNDNGGTSTGNPANVTLESSAYSDPDLISAMSAAEYEKLSGGDFKICVTRIEFVGRGESLRAEESALGLIDLSDNTQSTIWGEIGTTSGFSFDFIIVRVERDERLCGVDYSVEYKGEYLDTGFEMFFDFNQSQIIQDEDTYQINIEAIVRAIEDARQEDRFRDDQWEDYVRDHRGSGHRH